MDCSHFCVYQGASFTALPSHMPVQLPEKTQSPRSHSYLRQGPCPVVMNKEAEPKLGGRGKQNV